MNEMKLPCPVVRDLLPLYADRVVEPETARAVEEHLEDCPACRTALTALHSPEPAVPVADPGEAGAKLVKKVSRHAAVKALIVAACTLLIGLFLWIGITGNFPVVPVDAEHITLQSVVFAEEMGQRMYVVQYTLEDGVYWSSTYGGAEQKGSTLELTLRATPYRFWGEKKQESTFAFTGAMEGPIDQITFNGQVIWSAEEE